MARALARCTASVPLGPSTCKLVRPRTSAAAPATPALPPSLGYTDRCTYSNIDVADLVGQECLAAKVRRVHRVLVRIYDDALRPHGLTVAQLDLLATLLDHQGAARPSDLGRWLLMDRSTVTRNVERLSALGLVESGPGRTGREVELSVTAAGRRLARRSLEAWERAQGETSRLLGPDGVAALALLAERVNGQEED